jgi:hypothetical protein
MAGLMFTGGATAVPPGLENIVNWIEMQINNKLAQFNILQYLNASGVNISAGGAVLPPVLPPASNASAANATLPGALIAPSVLFNVSEYVASSTCQIQAGAQGATAANDTLCCNSPSNITDQNNQFCQSLAAIG